MTEYSDYWYQSADGLRLYARDYACQADHCQGTVLCMHGLTRNSADFKHLAAHLRRHYRVLCVDQRGRGRSDYDAEIERYIPLTYVEDMYTLLKGLGIDRVILVGTSMGGLMSMMMTAQRPELVQAVVINDIGPDISPLGLARLQSYVGKMKPVQSWDQAVVQTRQINAKEFPDFSDQQWLDFAQGLYQQHDGELRLAYDPALAAPFNDAESESVPTDLWPLFGAMAQHPLLLLRGEHSDILARDCAAAMQQKMPSMQLAEVPNRGHAPLLNEPTALAAIDQFLAKVTIRPSVR